MQRLLIGLFSLKNTGWILDIRVEWTLCAFIFHSSFFLEKSRNYAYNSLKNCKLQALCILSSQRLHCKAALLQFWAIILLAGLIRTNVVLIHSGIFGIGANEVLVDFRLECAVPLKLYTLSDWEKGRGYLFSFSEHFFSFSLHDLVSFWLSEFAEMLLLIAYFFQGFRSVNLEWNVFDFWLEGEILFIIPVILRYT